ncbi:MAG: hypothetical protein GXO70_07695 [Acidobacteria bacterium]|nr:hypothetical protein [Acidobacteriota bacterium]
MSETRDFLKRLKEEGLISADISCGKEHVMIRKKAIETAQNSKAFQQVKTQLMRRKKVSRKTLLYILSGILIMAVLVSLLDSNISSFYGSLLSSRSKNNNPAAEESSNLSETILASMDESGKTRELIRAARTGNLEMVQKILQLGTDLNGRDKKGNTPLITAIESGKNSIASLLLDTGASVNAAAKSGTTPVMAAARTGNRKLLSRLLKNGAKVEQADRKGNSALTYAIQSRCVPCTAMILKRGADVNRPDGKARPPLLIAAADGDYAMCDVLLKAGAFVDKSDPDGTTPLMKAAAGGKVKLVRILLSAGARIDATSKTGNSPLAEAAENRHPDMVHLLLTTAAEKKISLPDSVTVLNHALQKNDAEVITQMVLANIRKPLPVPPISGNNLKDWDIYRKFLRKALGEIACSRTDEKLRVAAGNGKVKAILTALREGADPASANKDKDNAVMLAVRNHQLAALKTLLGFGAPVETIDRESGESPLLIAAKIKDPRFVELLLQAGASSNTPGLNGYTAMDYAFAAGNRLVIPVLGKFGATAATEWNKNQWTPLEFVIANGKNQMLDMLIRNSADIDKTDTNGWSALHYAVMLGKASLVGKLLKKGADINLRDKKEWNPLHFAVLAGRLDILKNLVANGAKVNRKNDANWPPLYLSIALRHPDMTKILLKAGAKTRYKSSAKIVLPPLSFPKGSRADSITATLLRHNPKDPIANEIQKELGGK